MDARIQETHLTAPDHHDAEANRIEDSHLAVSPDQVIRSSGVSDALATRNTSLTTPQRSTRALAPDLLRGLLMVLQSLDHAVASLKPWQHGVSSNFEGTEVPVISWNRWVPWTARILSHLCAPGFMFLLGMGIVYFGRSRQKLKWSAPNYLYHFLIRAVALAAVCALLGNFLMQGKILMLNIVLLALAIDYFLVGVVWLGIHYLENSIAPGVDEASHSTTIPGERTPLLEASRSSKSFDHKALLWHVNNLVLALLAYLTIWWNVWLAPNQGRCMGLSDEPPPFRTSPWAFWLFVVNDAPYLVSIFPPLAWISFGFIGIIYGRIIAKRQWTMRQQNLGNLIAGLAFLLLFVATRVFHIGNLSEDCLRTTDQHGMTAGSNQYLQSFKSFFYVVKYPPSPAYLGLTMSGNFLLLAAFGTVPSNLARRIPALLVFGTSALFFYVVHLVLLTYLGWLIPFWFGHEVDWDDRSRVPGQPLYSTGNTPVFWITWIGALVLLNPLCKAYGQFKSLKPANSVWRFF